MAGGGDGEEPPQQRDVWRLEIILRGRGFVCLAGWVLFVCWNGNYQLSVVGQ